ncbi:MAG: NCS2 family permease [Phycisphaerae bacterium]|jgi:AGZA family xanthine/uracil permease-like MFS transporter|nr:NCS2 family permease [Phycisphaerae bacterium]
MLEKVFELKARGTNVRREIIAGAVTFLMMSYIIFVNPDILSKTGMDHNALIGVTILAAALGTLLVGLWANVPFAMAPGMGLNAFFTYTLVMGHEVSWEQALGVVFLSGVVFLLLTLVGAREKIVAAIPLSLRLGAAAGIGLFITFIGLQKLGFIVDNPATLVGLARSFDAKVALGMLGLAVMCVLTVRKVRGAILIGIISATIIGVLGGQVDVSPLGESWGVSSPPSIAPVFLKLDILGAMRISLIGAIFSFMFVDLFDSVGTIVACSHEAGLIDGAGRIRKINRMLQADAIATVAGSILGTSTTTTYIESGAGIAEGGRTGLASVVTGLLFLAALFLTPLIRIVPPFATAGALIMVGVFMFRNIREIDLSDFTVAMPAFLTIILMPLTYSISTGLAFGFVSHIVLTVAAGRIRSVGIVMWIIGALSLTDIMLQTGLMDTICKCMQ